jgi:hypothetical protein
MKKKARIGSSFDDFLKKDCLYKEVTPRAIRRVTARRRHNLANVGRRQGMGQSLRSER